MNKTPSILVDTGFEVDQNGALTEIIMPNVVTTLDTPKKIVFNGTTLNYIPSTTAALQEFEASNMTAISNANLFKGYTAINKITFLKLTSIIAPVSSQGNGLCYNCTALLTVDMPELISIADSASYQGGQFYSCTSLKTVNMPKLQTIAAVSNNISGQFCNCTDLTTINFPSLQRIETATNSNGGTFRGCTNLQDVTFGSEGHPVSAIGNTTFLNCTQSGLTITIYTSGGAALSGSPWGATNATIVYEEA